MVPQPDKGREMRAPNDVDEFPKGASPFGVEDLVGNVWQWTDEFEDTHTRAAILSTVEDHIDVMTRPVAPEGKRRSARMTRSTPGERSRALASTTVGSSPPSVRSMCTA